MIERKKGITVAMTVTMILVIMLLTTTITISVNSTLKSSKLRAFATELSLVQDTLDVYTKTTTAVDYILDDIYITVPTSLASTQFAGESITDGKVMLHTIDLSKIGIEKTVYGKLKSANDVYAVSDVTGKVYYVAGYDGADTVYYTLTQDLINIISNKEQIESASEEIIFVPNKTGWTNEAVQVKVQVPTTINSSTISIITDNSNIQISASTIVNNYTEYTVNTNSIVGNYNITVTYTLDDEQKEASYSVSAYDNALPTITYERIGWDETYYDSTFYAYIYGVTVTDNSNKIREIKYATISLTGDEAIKYFETNGTSITNGGKIRITPLVSEYTVYAEDYAGNISTYIITINSDTYELVKNWSVTWPGIVKTAELTNYQKISGTGANLIDYTIYGNTVDSVSVGDMSINILNPEDFLNEELANGETVSSNAETVLNNNWVVENLEPSTTYSFSFDVEYMEDIPDASTIDVVRSAIGLNIYSTTDESLYPRHRLYYDLTSAVNVGDKYHFETTFTTSSELHNPDANYNVLLYTYWYTEDGVDILGKVKLSNIQLELGDSPTEYEEYGKYVISVDVSGKNVFDMSALTEDENITIDEKGRLHLNGGSNKVRPTSKLVKDLKKYIKPDTTYTLTKSGYGWVSATSAAGTLRFYESDQSTRIKNFAMKNGLLTATFSMSNAELDALAYIYIYGNTDGTPEAIYDYIQIEEGATATKYEPFFEPQRFNIFLDEPLRKEGELVDYIDFENKKLYRNVGETSVTDIELPDIFLNKGTNIVSIDTTVAPSKINLTYYYKGSPSSETVENLNK